MKQTTQFFLEGESPTLKTMYKTRNTGTENGMWERGECGESRQTFWGMSSKILGNVAKRSGEYLCYSRK